jgi:Tfp pilus assembly PilM family ATPase
VTLDWAEVNVNSGEEGVRDILLAAIQNDALNRFMTLMQSANFIAPPTEIECFSTIRSIYDTSKPNVAVLDVGASVSKLYITESGLLSRMHRIPVAGSKVTEKIAEEKQISFADAEALKRAVVPGQPDYGLFQKINSVTFSRPLKEFLQVINEYEKRSGNEVTEIILTGGAVFNLGLETFFAEELNRPINLVSPFDKVAYPAFMEDSLRAIGPVFATALGAALRQFE